MQLDQLPDDIIYMICSHLPSRKGISSTCKHFNDIITPGCKYYYMLTSSYDIDFPLILRCNIGLYNHIFDTRYSNWETIYNNYTSDLLDKDIDYLYYKGYNDIISYIAYRSRDIDDIITRFDISELYRIGVLKLVDPFKIPVGFWDLLTYDQIMEIFDTNCRKSYLTEYSFDILISYILKYTTIDVVVDRVINIFGNRRYDTYYFVAISIAKLSPESMSRLLITVDDVVNFFYNVYENSVTGSKVDVKSVLSSIKNRFSVKDRMNIIRDYPVLYHNYKDFDVPSKFIANMLYNQALELIITKNLPIQLISPDEYELYIEDKDFDDLIDHYRSVLQYIRIMTME